MRRLQLQALPASARSYSPLRRNRLQQAKSWSLKGQLRRRARLMMMTSVQRSSTPQAPQGAQEAAFAVQPKRPPEHANSSQHTRSEAATCNSSPARSPTRHRASWFVQRIPLGLARSSFRALLRKRFETRGRRIALPFSSSFQPSTDACSMPLHQHQNNSGHRQVRLGRRWLQVRRCAMLFARP